MLVSSGQTEVLEQLKGECIGDCPMARGDTAGAGRWLTFTRDAPPFSSSD